MEDASSGVFIADSDYLSRRVQLGIASGNVISVQCPPGNQTPSASHPILDRLIAYLDNGNQDNFTDVPIALTVSSPQRRILEMIRELPFGDERSPESIADQLAILEPGDEAVHTVRETCNANPIPIIIPDHRVSGITGATDSDVRTQLRQLEHLE